VEKRTITKWDRLSNCQQADALAYAEVVRRPPRSLWRASIPAADWGYRFLGQLPRRDCLPTPYIEPRRPKGLFGEAQKLLTSIVISLRPMPAIAISFGHWSRD